MKTQERPGDFTCRLEEVNGTETSASPQRVSNNPADMEQVTMPPPRYFCRTANTRQS